MARGHGRTLTSIWEDSDFLALDEREQRLYLFLISQPNLNHAGLLPLTLRRWSRKARELTSADLEKRLQALEDARFIVMDDDTEELLIRSFVRNDGVWRMPKVMGAMVSGAMEISSRRLQAALLAEMDRIPLEELNDEPTKYKGQNGPSIRQQVALHIETLRKAFGTPDPDPSRRGSGTPSDPLSKGGTEPPQDVADIPDSEDAGTPSAPPSGTPSETLPEGGRKPSTRGHAGALHARSPAPAPTPAPTPDPIPVVVEVGGETSGSSPQQAERPDGLAPIDTDQFAVTDTMRRWAHATYPGLDIEHSTAQFVSHYRSTGARRQSWPDAWQKWIRDDAKRASQRQQYVPSNVIQLPSGQTLTGTDATVAGWAALSIPPQSEDSA